MSEADGSRRSEESRKYLKLVETLKLPNEAAGAPADPQHKPFGTLSRTEGNRRDHAHSYCEGDNDVEVPLMTDVNKERMKLLNRTPKKHLLMDRDDIDEDVKSLVLPQSVKELNRLQLRKEGKLQRRASFNAKVVWRRASNRLMAISRLNCIAKEIQRYGSPAYGASDEQLEEMVRKATYVTLGKKKNGPPLPCGVLHPKSRFKIYWSLLLILLLLYSAFVSPVRIAFADSDAEEGMAWVVIEAVVDILFGLDIFVNFISAYYDDDDNLIGSRRTIVINYMKLWFWIDLLASFPFQLVFSGIPELPTYNDLLRLLRLPRLYRLFKVLKLTKTLSSGKNDTLTGYIFESIQMNASTLKDIM
jgi:hypothetical protein